MHKHPPLQVYFTTSFVTSLLYSLIFTVNLLYYIFIARLDPLQLVLVGTVLEASIFIFEVPTGVLADSVSRRLSVIIGVFLIGVAFVVNGTWPDFWVILAAQVLWGLGYTFTSGASQAWISDEVGEENAGSAYIRAARWDQWGGIAGTILSVLLALISIRVPILVGGILFLVLGTYLVFFMPEDGYTPQPLDTRTRWQQFFGTFRQGISVVKVRPALISILAAGFIFGLYSEGYDRLWQAHILERFTLPAMNFLELRFDGVEMTATFWNAAFKLVLLGLAALATKVAEKQLHHPKMNNLARGLLLLSLVLFAGLIGFALAGNLLAALACALLIGVTREVIYPVYTTWVNHRLPANVRATVLSFSSQMDAVGQTLGGPIVGIVAKQVSITAGLLTSSAMLAPVLPILFKQRKL
jgi:DHA3 family tetracycline resistance protein-like MFS transporter